MVLCLLSIAFDGHLTSLGWKKVMVVWKLQMTSEEVTILGS